MKQALEKYRKELEAIREAGTWKGERIITTPQKSRIDTTQAKKVVNMCANNYLGLSNHPALIEAAKASYDQWGFGLSSVRFICGTQSIHKELEEKLAKFLGMDDVILYSSCFDANGGLFETLLGPEDAIISDELNHASIIDGVRLCKAKRYRYKNNDMNDLRAQLEDARSAGCQVKLIATDGVFSMDGYIANLKGICDLADEFDALVMVDDSHAVGFMGDTGRGTPEYCGVQDRVDIITGTFGKALGGASGGFTAAVIGGEKYTVPQVAYYYQQICNNYASMFGQEYLQSLKTQSYDDDQTWNDYFKSEAINSMKFIHAAKTAAKEAGLTLEAEDKETVKANVDGMKSAAAAAGYGYGAYLKALYGATMTSGVFESCLEDQILASKYATQYSDEKFVYSDEEIQKYYEENKNSYDVVDAAYITISGKPEAKTDDEGNTIEATDEEKAAAMDEAKEMAEDILDVYKTSRALPEDYDEKAVYTANEEMRYSAGVLGDWLFDSARKAGDAEILVDEENSRCYVAVFNGRERREALEYSVRHILVTAENLDLPEGETATEEQLRAKAQEILDSWDGTEEGFASLANQNSKDPGSNTNGGLYEDVPQGRMVAPFQDWCYEEGRKAGDTGVVYYSGSNYSGAHAMYFVGYGDTPYWQYACENALRSAAQTEWQNELTNSVTAESNSGGMKLVG